jgi:hypothetical protein
MTLLIAFAALFTLAPGISAEESSIIAAQVHVLPGTSWDETEQFIDELADAGFNAIIIRVFHNRHDRYHEITGLKKDEGPTGVYFRTSLAPTIHDVLTPLSGICRRRGMRIFAWMTTRRMDWLDMPEARDRRFDETVKSLEDSQHFDIYNIDFRDYLFDIYADLASMPLDGIVLQDDFVILTREGFSTAALDAFRRDTTQAIDPAEIFNYLSNGEYDPDNMNSKLSQEWAVFKSGHVASIGDAIIDACKSVNQELLIGMNLYYDTMYDPDKGRRWLGQDISAILNSRFDLVFAMAYHRQMAEELDIDVTEAIAELNRNVSGLIEPFDSRLVIKLQLRDWSSGDEIGQEELSRIISEMPSDIRHIALAPVEPGTQKKLWEVILKAPRRRSQR